MLPWLEACWVCMESKCRAENAVRHTCCKMLPLLERGWLAGGEQHVVVDTRRNITVFLATKRLWESSARSTHG